MNTLLNEGSCRVLMTTGKNEEYGFIHVFSIHVCTLKYYFVLKKSNTVLFEGLIDTKRVYITIWPRYGRKGSRLAHGLHVVLIFFF